MDRTEIIGIIVIENILLGIMLIYLGKILVTMQNLRDEIKKMTADTLHTNSKLSTILQDLTSIDSSLKTINNSMKKEYQKKKSQPNNKKKNEVKKSNNKKTNDPKKTSENKSGTDNQVKKVKENDKKGN